MMRPTIEQLSKILELLSKAAGIIALVVGAWWTYSQFTIHRENAENVNITLEPKVVAEGTDAPLILANVALDNIGKVPVRAGRYNKEHEGLELTVIEYKNPKKGIGQNKQVIDWELGGDAPPSSEWPVVAYNMIGEYTAYKNGNYNLNPGSKCKESVAIPAKPGKLYLLRVRFFSESGWSTSDLAYIYTSTATAARKTR